MAQVEIEVRWGWRELEDSEAFASIRQFLRRDFLERVNL